MKENRESRSKANSARFYLHVHKSRNQNQIILKTKENGRGRFWGSRNKNIAPLDIGSGQGLEIMLRDIAN